MKPLLYFLLVTLLLSCQSNLIDDVENQAIVDTFEYDCKFVLNPEVHDEELDSVEQAIMSECWQNQFRTIRQIENNLIGEWILVGYALPQVQHKTQPCGYINIELDSLIFDYENEYYHETSAHAWEVVRKQFNGEDYFTLETSPNNYTLKIGTFSEKYMYRNLMGLDGPTHIFEKVSD